MTFKAVACAIPGAVLDPTSTPECVVVPSDQWRAGALVLRDAGATRAEWLTAVDVDGQLRVVTLLCHERAQILLATNIPDARIPSLCDVWASLQWHERECSEMFGITFEGLADTRPLLLAGVGVQAPLCRDTALTARIARPWPGAVTASGVATDAPARGRRAIGLPPGVHPQWHATQPPDKSGELL